MIFDRSFQKKNKICKRNYSKLNKEKIYKSRLLRYARNDASAFFEGYRLCERQRSNPVNKKTYFYLAVIFTLFTLAFLSVPSAGAQASDTTTLFQPETAQDFSEIIIAENEDVAEKKDTVIYHLSDGAPDPHKATLWALLPGGGQIYNWAHHDKWWAASLKLAVIYGGFGTLTYFIIRNTNDYRDFRNAYKWESTDGEIGKENQYTGGQYSPDQLKSYMDYYLSNMEWCYLITGILYGLQIVEATVTAHLLTFDVSDDLSLGIKPMPVPMPQQSAIYTAGFSVKYKFNYK